MKPHIQTIEKELRERLARGDEHGAIEYAKSAVREAFQSGMRIGSAGDVPPEKRKRRFCGLLRS